MLTLLLFVPRRADDNTNRTDDNTNLRTETSQKR